MKLEYLKQADVILSKCGRPLLPGGVAAVPLVRSFILPMVLQPGGAVTFTKEITGSAPWGLRAISSDQSSAALTGVRLQIQLPNGRFLFGGNGVDVGQFTGFGSWRWNQDPELRCEPGSKIQATLTDSGGLAEAVAVNLLFEGALLYFITGANFSPAGLSASSLPRYQGIVNENILAPAWWSNEGVNTPPGYVDEYFVYSTPDPIDEPAQTTWTVTAGAVSAPPDPLPFEVQIDPGYVFHCRRVLFDLQMSAALYGTIVLGKLRTGAGYVVNDNYIDLQRYLTGAEFPTNWKINGGDSVFADLALADIPNASGSVTFQVFLEGFRRRKA